MPTSTERIVTETVLRMEEREEFKSRAGFEVAIFGSAACRLTNCLQHEYSMWFAACWIRETLFPREVKTNASGFVSKCKVYTRLRGAAK